MNVPVWHIVTWPEVALTEPAWKALGGFDLLGWSSHQDEEGRMRGNTLWASDEASGRIGLAWDWCETDRNVLVMCDPMSVLSNVVISGAEDRRNDFKRTIHLNNAIYQLPWQRQLRSLVRPRTRKEVEVSHQLAREEEVAEAVG